MKVPIWREGCKCLVKNLLALAPWLPAHFAFIDFFGFAFWTFIGSFFCTFIGFAFLTFIAFAFLSFAMLLSFFAGLGSSCDSPTFSTRSLLRLSVVTRTNLCPI